jgi:hypothetical protein
LHCAPAFGRAECVLRTRIYWKKGKGRGKLNGNSRFLHCVIALRANTPVEMTPRGKIEFKGEGDGRGQPRVSPLRDRAVREHSDRNDAEMQGQGQGQGQQQVSPVEMTPKFKCKGRSSGGELRAAGQRSSSI